MKFVKLNLYMILLFQIYYSAHKGRDSVNYLMYNISILYIHRYMTLHLFKAETLMFIYLTFCYKNSKCNIIAYCNIMFWKSNLNSIQNIKDITRI